MKAKKLLTIGRIRSSHPNLLALVKASSRAIEGRHEIVTDREYLAGPFRKTTHEEIMKLCAPDIMRLALKNAWTKGVGIAAPQVGIPIKFAIYQIDKGPEVWLVNPEIVNASGLTAFKGEGCLSIPKAWFDTWRYSTVTILNDVDGQRIPFEVHGFEAFVVQHEIDHLNGVLCCSRVAQPEKPGRNDACPCGSGIKFKKCCINKQEVGADA